MKLLLDTVCGMRDLDRLDQEARDWAARATERMRDLKYQAERAPQ